MYFELRLGLLADSAFIKEITLVVYGLIEFDIFNLGAVVALE